MNGNIHGILFFDRSSDAWNHVYVLNPRNFELFLSSVKNESFDDGKISLILSSAQTMYFTSQQVKEIIETFSFDDNKLKIAKIYIIKPLI